jgi:hypothetical protein
MGLYQRIWYTTNKTKTGIGQGGHEYIFSKAK